MFIPLLNKDIAFGNEPQKDAFPCPIQNSETWTKYIKYYWILRN